MSVLGKQRFYQAGHGPIYTRTPASRVVVKGLYGVIIGGALLVTFNLGRLIAGQKP